MATSHKENFEKVDLHEFRSSAPIKIASGMSIYQKRFLKLLSGIRAASSPANANSKDLVVGGYSIVRLVFESTVKDLSFEYHMGLESSYRGMIEREAAQEGQRPDDRVKLRLREVATLRFHSPAGIKEHVLGGTLDTLTFYQDVGEFNLLEIESLTQHEVRLEIIRWNT